MFLQFLIKKHPYKDNNPSSLIRIEFQNLIILRFKKSKPKIKKKKKIERFWSLIPLPNERNTEIWKCTIQEIQPLPYLSLNSPLVKKT